MWDSDADTCEACGATPGMRFIERVVLCDGTDVWAQEPCEMQLCPACADDVKERLSP